MPIQPDKRGLWYVGTDSGAESEKERYANARRPECFLSMQQRIDGERRIDIAKSTLTGLVNDVPSGDIGFAFRVFGHKEADSCRTDLEMAKIASVQTMNLATAIGESLRLAAADIAGRPLPDLFILVTD